MVSIDLNADMGESYGAWRLGDDAELCRVVTSANIACGFHAGDPLTLLTTCRAAVSEGVAIGAQVGYPDLVGFGRRYIDIAPEDLTAAVLYQVGALVGMAKASGGRVTYVKPHGALYNRAAVDEIQARAVVEAVRSFDASLPVVGLAGSILLREAGAAGLRGVPEAFVDRAYKPDGQLVGRRSTGALITEPEVAADRAEQMALERTVRATDGSNLMMVAESLCVHGDSPGAVAMARAVADRLVARGVTLRAFTAS
jgi:5-oxoprolinase (ATP-hydrolysing) subunit A